MIFLRRKGDPENHCRGKWGKRSNPFIFTEGREKGEKVFAIVLRPVI